MLTEKMPLKENDVTLAPRRLGLKLDLGCGETPRNGFEGVDLYASKAKWKQNLLEFPWPWGDEQVAEIHCSHFIEHIPMAFVDSEGEISIMPKEDSTDLLVKFFDECHRILVPGGKMICQWPCNRNDRAFQDPSHRRFIPPMIVGYLNKRWRDMNGLGHYLGSCNFTDGNGNIAAVIPIGINPEFEYFSQEASGRRMLESWNTVGDWQATLIKEAPQPLP